MRLSLLTAHYRQPVDFSNSNAKEQKRRLDRWYRITAEATAAEVVPATVIQALSDDLNTPKAIAALDALASEETAGELLAGAQFMGLLMQSAEDWFKTELSVEQEAWITENSVKYAEARAVKDFAEADRIRDEAAEQGLVIEIAAGGEIKFKAQ